MLESFSLDARREARSEVPAGRTRTLDGPIPWRRGPDARGVVQIWAEVLKSAWGLKTIFRSGRHSLWYESSVTAFAIPWAWVSLRCYSNPKPSPPWPKASWAETADGEQGVESITRVSRRAASRCHSANAGCVSGSTGAWNASL